MSIWTYKIGDCLTLKEDVHIGNQHYAGDHYIIRSMIPFYDSYDYELIHMSGLKIIWGLEDVLDEKFEIMK